MLKDRRSDAFVEGFFGQWPGSRKVLDVTVDPKLFPEFSTELKEDLRRETSLFVESIVRENRSALDLLTAEDTYLNGRLAKFYGVPGPGKSEDFRKVSLAGTPRQGVLTRGSILMLTSYPNRTSPTRRGNWILETILGEEPPPPPDNVPELAQTQATSPDLPLRKQLELHRVNATCVSCHRTMDAIGFGFENFDAIGPLARPGSRPADRCSRRPAVRRQVQQPEGTHSHPVPTTGRFRPAPGEPTPDIRSRPRRRVLRSACARSHRKADAGGQVPVPGLASRGGAEPSISMATRRTRGNQAMMQRTLSRRTFLRGAGVAMGLPLLEGMLPGGYAATATAKPPVRLGWVYFPNGMVRESWTPKGTGRDFEFNTTSAPLAPVRDHVMLITNLAHDRAQPNGDGAGAHAREGATFLTAVQAKKTGGKDIYLGESIDQVIARQIGRQTRLPSLELGVEPNRKEGRCDSGYSCIYMSNISWRSATQPSSVEINPRRAFDRLFGAKGEDGARFRERSAARQSVLDFVGEDASRLQKQLGATDRRKLAEYLESVRAVERQIAQMKSLPPIDVPAGSRPSGEPEDFVAHTRLMYDLMALAWQTDATRVITFMLANSQTNRVYENLGIKSGHHQLTHSTGQDGDIQKIDEFVTAEFARFVAKLRDIPEGQGSLLDNCLITLGSAMGDGRKHDHGELPVVVAGHAGGAVAGGRHLKLESETPMSNLFVSTAQLAGVKLDRFGDSRGSLSALAGS